MRGFARAVLLREHHLLVRAALGAPCLHATLERAQLPFLVAPRVLLHQHLEERFCFERRCLGQQRLQLWPVLDERILACPPVTWLYPLRRQLAALRVFTRSLPIYAGSHRCEAEPAMLRHLFHQLPHLRVRRAHRHMIRSCGPRQRPIGAPQDGEK